MWIAYDLSYPRVHASSLSLVQQLARADSSKAPSKDADPSFRQSSCQHRADYEERKCYTMTGLQDRAIRRTTEVADLRRCKATTRR